MNRPQKLLTPGPTSVPPEVLRALSEPVLHHRSPDFAEVFALAQERLRDVFRTENEILVLTSSGTGAFESAVVNLLSPGERVLAVSQGEFGQRWQSMAGAFGCDVVPLDYPWGAAPRPDDLRSALAESGAKTAIVVHSETSTGVVCDLEPLLAVCREAGALSLVDAVSSLGAVRLETDAWGADVVVTGSQKALMTPPGLAFAAVSDRAWERSRTASLPRFYFDWARQRRAQAKGSTPSTPATSLVVALVQALGLVLEDGLDAAFARHRALGRACRAGIKAIGLELYSPDDDSAAVLTGALTPEGVDAVELRLALRDRHGITIAGGHGELVSRLFRIGHIGHVTIDDLAEALTAVEVELREAGADAEVGRAAAAAFEAFGSVRVRRLMRVLVREPIADAGVELLRSRFDVDVDTESPLEEIVDRYDAIVIRSATKMTGDVLSRATRLKVIGRAGVGVDNVDVDAATRRGIVVANAPESTIVSAAEQTIGLIVALARNIPQAHAALKAGRWERSRFGGIELAGKTLGVVGFGRIGQQVARRALGLAMNVVAYDPFVGRDRFRDLGVEQVETLDELLGASDVVTLHSPLTDETRSLVDRDAIAKMRDGARLVNAARGQLVDEDALAEAIRSGKLAGAALDVFSSEPYTGPLLELEQVVVTPHLAASTDEAQDRAGVIVAEQIVAALEGGIVTNAVNIPVVDQADLEVLRPFIPLTSLLGRIVVELAGGAPRRVTVAAHGPLAEYDMRLLTAAALNGVFQQRVDQVVNVVNATVIAAERGIDVVEERDRTSRDYTNTVEVRLLSDGEEVTVTGTTIGPEPRLFIGGALGFGLDMEIAPHMIFIHYVDTPGVIGRVGSMLGEAGVNIANMAVSRSKEGGEALMAMSIDTPATPELLAALREMGFYDVRHVELG